MARQTHTTRPATPFPSKSWNRERLRSTRVREARQQGERPREARQRERDIRQRQQQRQRQRDARKRQQEQERQEKLQAAKLLMETPLRPNSFFTHLNEDIRHVVYNYLPLCPLKDGKQSAGLILSCREAKQEVEAASACAFWLMLTKLKKNFEGGTLKLGNEITSKESLAGLERIEITIDGEFSINNLMQCRLLTALHLDRIHIHFRRYTNSLGHDCVASAGHIARLQYPSQHNCVVSAGHIARVQYRPQHVCIADLAAYFFWIVRHTLNVKEIVLSYNFVNPAITQGQDLEFKLAEFYQDSVVARSLKSVVQHEDTLVPKDFVWPVRRDAMAVNYEGQMGSISYRSEMRWKLKTANKVAAVCVDITLYDLSYFYHGSRWETVIAQGPETVAKYLGNIGE